MLNALRVGGMRTSAVGIIRVTGRAHTSLSQATLRVGADCERHRSLDTPVSFSGVVSGDHYVTEGRLLPSVREEDNRCEIGDF